MKTSLFFLSSIMILLGCKISYNSLRSNDIPVDIQIKKEGLEYSSNDSSFKIKGERIVFPGKVSAINIDSIDLKALIYTHKAKTNPYINPGTLIYYDIKLKKIIWSKITYFSDAIFLPNMVIIQLGLNKVIGLNKETGEQIWERKGGFNYYDRNNKIGFTGYIKAFSLETGLDLWQRPIASKFDWEEGLIKDSIFIRTADGIHTFNLKSGEGWDIKMSTGKEDELGALVKDIGKSALFALAGFNYYGTTSANEFSGLSSNILLDSTNIFFAARDKLVCADFKTGKEIWKVKLPHKKTGKTMITFSGDDVLIVNKAFCYKNGLPNFYGKPYLAKYNKLKGTSLFSSQFETKWTVADIIESSKGYTLLSKDAIQRFSVEGEKKQHIVSDSMSGWKYGEFQYFVNKIDSGLYFQNNIPLSLANFSSDNNSLTWVQTNSYLLALNDQLEIVRAFPNDQVCFSKKVSGEFKIYNVFSNHESFISAENPKLTFSYFFTDKSDNLIGKLTTPTPVDVLHSLYYFADKNSIVTIQPTKD